MRTLQSLAKKFGFPKALAAGAGGALVAFFAAFAVGYAQGKVWATLSLIGTSILLEAQPAAVASVPLGFHPVTGAIISILANLIPIPLLMLTFDELIRRWGWANRRLKKAEKWSHKYGKYGVWILTILCPFLGAYVCITIGYAMRWKPTLVFLSVSLGMAASAFLIAFGGHSVSRIFH
ncbi:small multi-drug export protein [Alicyclobacillus dauci]|uniref:Small multi-drug export protein n=1 Tax=Alicyclobacillus dauci TaxID=1475485 RepID=A0ABY6Z6Z8_9BACL|nr:small multi-drug export protein [Alicyclobacillus dauci]WAH38298.1 small multi-drug export protein [Alicyclobacillus dauci]